MNKFDTDIQRKQPDPVTAQGYYADENGDQIPDNLETQLKRVPRLNNDIISQYKAVLNPSESFWTRLRLFMGASSATGRGAKAVKDFLLLFVPWGRKVRSVSEFITERFIKPKYKTEAMMKKQKKSPQPSTLKGLAIFVSLLALVGIHLDAAAVSQLVGNIITGLSLAVPAGIALWEMVRDEVFLIKNE